jgi:O-antigen/teichoic acid export membrane protein
VYGIPLIPHLLAMWALNFSDRPIVGSMVSVTEAGVYAVGYQFGMVVAILIAGINNAWSPWFFETSAAGRSDRIPAMTSVFVMLTAAITLGLVLFSRPSIRLLTASPYHEAWKVVPLVAVGYFVNGLTLRVLDVILLHKRTRVVPLTTLTAVAVNIGFNLVAIPRLGMLAAAYGTVLGYGVRLVLTGFFAIRMGTLPVEWRRTAWVCGLFAVLAGGGLCLAMDPAWLDLALRLGLWMLFPVGLVVTGTVRWSELRGFLEGVMGQGGNPGRSKRD